jgi:transposase
MVWGDQFVRWALNGTWPRLLKVMQKAAYEASLVDWDGAGHDVTPVKAHRAASGTQKNAPTAEKKKALAGEWLGRSRGDITSKIHRCGDGHGAPSSFPITAGHCRDSAQSGPVLDAMSVSRSGRGRLRKRLTFLRVTALMADAIIESRSSSVGTSRAHCLDQARSCGR